MVCQPLRNLFDQCQTHQFHINPVEVVRAACQNCQQIEVCPALSGEEYESRKKEQLVFLNTKTNS